MTPVAEPYLSHLEDLFPRGCPEFQGPFFQNVGKQEVGRDQPLAFSSIPTVTETHLGPPAQF